MPGRLLVVDEEPRVGEGLRWALALEGYKVTLATDETEALRSVEVEQPDAVVLDVDGAETDGVDLCRRLRERGEDVPVLLLTEDDTVGHWMAGLEDVADDVLAKPFELDELLGRLDALLSDDDGSAPSLLRFGDLELDRDSHEVRRAKRLIELTPTEFALLELFMSNPGHVLTREFIFTRVWGFDFASMSNSLNVFVGHVRRKTEAGGEPRVIHTVRGVGYVLRERP